MKRFLILLAILLAVPAWGQPTPHPQGIPRVFTGLPEKTTLTGADIFVLDDSAAGNVAKKITVTNLLAYLNGALAYASSSSIDPGHKHSNLWASDGTPKAIWFDASGNGCIGTLAPELYPVQSRLVIATDDLAEGTADYIDIFHSGTAGTSPIKHSFGAYINPTRTQRYAFIDSTDLDGYLPLVLQNTPDAGNVGIGTITVPREKFEVRTSVTNQGVFLGFNSGVLTGNSVPIFLAGTNNASQISNVSLEAATNDGNGSADLIIRTGASSANSFGTARGVIKGIGGNWGVKVTTLDPIFDLDVNGGAYSRLRYGRFMFEDAAIGTQLVATPSGSVNLFVTGGTNKDDANITLQATGLQITTTALDDDSATVRIALPVLNTTQNPKVSFRFKVNSITNACVLVGLSGASFADKATPADNCALIGIDADNGHTYGAARLVLLTKDDAAAGVYDDTGTDMVNNTWVWGVVDLTDTEQPRVWIAGTEVAAGSITGTVKDATNFYLYFHVQNLAAGAHTMTVVCDHWQQAQP